MTYYSSDWGFGSSVMSVCVACGSRDNIYCCDGEGNRLSFDLWASYVDAEICKIEGTEKNEITGNYAKMYNEGLTVLETVNRVYNG